MSRVIGWVFVAKLLIACAILFSGVGLMPDEAQYWTWSKELSYGYYSKPPGIAWQIAFGCLLFGDTEFGVRFGSLLLSFFLSIGIYRLAIAAGLDERRSFWSAIAFAFCPLGLLSGFFATTDCAYVLFWTLGCLLAVQTPCRFSAIGAVIAIGALWKWPLYALWIPVLLFRVDRASISKVLLGVAISLLGLVPSLIWNLQYDFPTFHHVAASMNPLHPAQEETGANPFSFIGAQVALVSPILFGLLIWRFAAVKKTDRALAFCWWTTVLFISAMLLLSCVKKVQGNWAVAAYPTAFVILLVTTLQRSFVRWLQAGIVVSILLVAFLFAAPGLRINPLKQGVGWHNLESILLSAGYNPDREFLFSDRYQWTSLLSFYGPEKKRAFFLNLHDVRKNQFCYWPSMKERCLGQNGWFVAFIDGKEGMEKASSVSGHIQTMLKKYFREVTVVQPTPLAIVSGSPLKIVILLHCFEYNGNLPTSSSKY